MIIPLNRETEKIFYNLRALIDAKILTEPRAWVVSKVNRLTANGLVNITFAEDHFDPHHDFIEKDEEGNVIGMWADYWTEGVQPTIYEEPETKIYSQITYTGLSPKIKIGGNYRTFTVKFYDDVGEVPLHTGEWKFTIADTDVSEYVSIKKDSALQDNQIKFKFIGDDGYIGKNLVISYISEDNIKSSVEMNICGL